MVVRVAGAILLLLVGGRHAVAQDGRLAKTLPSVGAEGRLSALVIPSVEQADWQGRLDRAEARKDAGKKKMLIGVLTAGGGLILAVSAAQSCAASSIFDLCDDEASLATVALMADIAGAGIFVWGAVEYTDGSNELSRLEAQRSRGSASIRFGEHHTLSFRAGSQPSAAYSFGW